MAKKRTVFSEAYKTRYSVNQLTGCWVWNGARAKGGYGQWQIGKTRRLDGSYDRQREYAHRLMWETIKGPIPDGLYVLHKCDNPSCINPEHLFVGTSADNSRDMAEKGRSARGERQGGSRLTTKQVIEIRNTAGSLTEIAKKYGVSSGAIDDIKNRRTWKHIPGERIDDPKKNQGKPGSAHARAILSEPDIPSIRSRYAGGEKIIDIAHSYGVSDMVIRHVVKGRTWKHVP